MKSAERIYEKSTRMKTKPFEVSGHGERLPYIHVVERLEKENDLNRQNLARRKEQVEIELNPENTQNRVTQAYKGIVS